MTETNTIELIAPCGMNCAICSRYLVYVNNLERSQCQGCRPSNKKCSYLFEKCTGMNHALEGNSLAGFCFDCDLYPCKEINRMDNRYKKNYGMSVKENLNRIQHVGLEQFTQEQIERYSCSKCGGFISIHNKACFHCDTITKLVDKS